MTNDKTKNKKTIGITIVLLLLLALIAAAIVYYLDARNLKDHFGRFVTVNGQSLKGMTAAKAAEQMNESFLDNHITLMENGTAVYELSYGEAGYSLDTTSLTESFQKIIKNQKAGFHFFEKSSDVSVDYPVTRADDVFASSFTAEKISGERTDAADAYVQYDEAQGKFIVVQEIPGTRIADDALQAFVRNALDTQLTGKDIPETLEITLDDSVYIKPAVTADQEAIQNQVATLNAELDKYHNVKVTHLFGDTKEVIDGDLVCSWLIVDNNSVVLSEDAVRDYVSQLGTKYNTIYRDRNFTTTSGETVKLEHNEYGYLIDQEGEFQQLYGELTGGQTVEREPVYSKSGYKRNGKDDLLGTYIEVSIDKQHLWLYKDGALITETDIVSGKPSSKETATYKGAWPIAYKKSPYTLSSDYYGYKVPVNYWMPFVYGQGLHDMNRSAYGGDIYLTNGSHGCVNLPLDQAKIIYETIGAGYPIILY